jgi:hypothetical protein
MPVTTVDFGGTVYYLYLMVRHQTTAVEGYIPPGVYAPSSQANGCAQQWSSLESSRANWTLMLNWLGVTKGRLYTLLGSAHPNNVYPIGRTGRLAPYMHDRMDYLLFLKEKRGVVISKIRHIDWESGVIIFDADKP